MSAEQHTYDVIIAGGGTTGICLTLNLLKNTQLKVAIIEAHDQSGNEFHPGFDSRSVALASHSVELLKQIGLASVSQFGSPIEHIHVSDKGHLGQCRMHAQEYNIDALGQVVELSELGRALFGLVKNADHKRLSWYRPDTVEKVERTEEQVVVTTLEGKRLNGKLLVIAEGGNSPTREKIGLSVKQYHYGQVALIANVETDKPHENWAFERFTQTGPLAMLPLRQSLAEQGNGVCSLVWTLAQSQKDAMLELSDAEFLSALQSEFGHRLGKLIRVGKRDVYPLVLTHAQDVISHRTVVIGNAAQTLHPIAGQGLNLALRDIQCLSQVLQFSADAGQDPGCYACLHDYSQSREKDRQSVIGMTDSLVRIFSNNYLPFVVGRNIGLSALNLMPTAKSMLANQAMGRVSATQSCSSTADHKEH